MEGIDAALQRVHRLLPGWFDKESEAVDPRTIQIVRILLRHLARLNFPLPTISPAPTGAIDLVWTDVPFIAIVHPYEARFSQTPVNKMLQTAEYEKDSIETAVVHILNQIVLVFK